MFFVWVRPGNVRSHLSIQNIKLKLRAASGMRSGMPPLHNKTKNCEGQRGHGVRY